MKRLRAKLSFAGLTDVGQRRLANEDAWHVDERLGLFVVCDGIGGQPSGEAASQLVAHALPHAVRRRLRKLKSADAGAIEQTLAQAVVEISGELFTHAEQIPGLRGMGATLVAALIDRQQAHLVHIGDSRIYHRDRSGAVTALTEDQVKHFRRFASVESAAAGGSSDDRRLLSQYVGMRREPSPVVRTMTLEPGDRLVLCTDGVTDPVPVDRLAQLIARADPPQAICRALVEAANTGGGPDNITAIVVDHEGLDEAEAPPVPPRTPAAPHGVARALHEALSLLEADLAWLRAGAAELEGRPMLSAFAAVKRRLGPEIYQNFLQLHPSKNPTHVFHRACTLPGTGWRERYEQHLGQLDPLLEQVAGGTVRMSPILTGEETGMILRTLWRDWRIVERRYFAATSRDAISETDQTLSRLILHMHQSVQTMLGLLIFFPRFMRHEA